MLRAWWACLTCSPLLCAECRPRTFGFVVLVCGCRFSPCLLWRCRFQWHVTRSPHESEDRGCLCHSTSRARRGERHWWSRRAAACDTQALVLRVSKGHACLLQQGHECMCYNKDRVHVLCCALKHAWLHSDVAYTQALDSQL